MTTNSINSVKGEVKKVNGFTQTMSSADYNLVEQYREEKRIYVVKFKTATESDQSTVDRITRLLKEFDSCATVEYEKVIDRDIIGGFVAQVGNNRLDASVRTQLNEIARNLRG